jgi:hypothetical protein
LVPGCRGEQFVERDDSVASCALGAVGHAARAVNNLAKRIKRVAFGLVNFRHRRVRCLLYTGEPDWTLLPAIQT